MKQYYEFNWEILCLFRTDLQPNPVEYVRMKERCFEDTKRPSLADLRAKNRTDIKIQKDTKPGKLIDFDAYPDFLRNYVTSDFSRKILKFVRYALKKPNKALFHCFNQRRHFGVQSGHPSPNESPKLKRTLFVYNNLFFLLFWCCFNQNRLPGWQLRNHVQMLSKWPILLQNQVYD